jgi:hypothetical protein
MGLVFTFHQLSAIKCADCKRSTLAMTSLAVEDDISTFIFNCFKDVVYQLYATQNLQVFYDSYVDWLYQGCGVERYKFQIGHFSRIENDDKLHLSKPCKISLDFLCNSTSQLISHF